MAELKRRAAKVIPTVTVARKRNRIVSTVPKRMDGKSDYTASTLLVFPTDPLGLCVGLRKELIKLASKMHGDETKVKLVKHTLSIGMKHLDAKYKETGKLSKANTSLKSRSATITARQEAERILAEDLTKEDV